MNVKIHSSELGRMMRVLSSCIGLKDTKFSNVEISHENNLFSIRATNGSHFVKMSTPLLGGDGESFCVDGKMFGNVISKANGEVSIDTNGNVCVIKANGRTRIPIVNDSLPIPEPINGKSVSVQAADFISVSERVRYAAGTDENRLILTGILTETYGNELTMVALDGFQMAIESSVCEGEDIKIVIPNILLKRICDCAGPEEDIKIVTDGKRVCLSTDTSEVIGSLLAGEYIDYQRLIPESFATKVLFSIESMKDALKGSSVVGNAKNLVKFIVHGDKLTITSNSEEAEFDADIECRTEGNDLTIAFNDRYVLNALNAVSGEEAILNLGTAVSPAVIRERTENGVKTGIHLVLPVRVM